MGMEQEGEEGGGGEGSAAVGNVCWPLVVVREKLRRYFCLAVRAAAVVLHESITVRCGGRCLRAECTILPDGVFVFAFLQCSVELIFTHDTSVFLCNYLRICECFVSRRNTSAASSIDRRWVYVVTFLGGATIRRRDAASCRPPVLTPLLPAM